MTADDKRVVALLREQVAAGELPGVDAADVDAFERRLNETPTDQPAKDNHD